MIRPRGAARLAIALWLLSACRLAQAQDFVPAIVDRSEVPLTDWKVASTAGGGTAIDTNISRIVIPAGTVYTAITARNFATGVVAQVRVLPYMAVLVTTDSLATVATNASSQAQDGNAANHVTLSSLDTAANGDYVLLGATQRIGGVFADVDATNTNTATLTAEYWNGSAWTSLSATDNTASGGNTLNQDGTITWTAPAAWTRATLQSIGMVTGDVPVAVAPRVRDTGLFWSRLRVSAALDSSVTLDQLLSIHQAAAASELLENQVMDVYAQKGVGGIAAIQARMDAGTGNLVINVAAGPDGFRE